MNADSLQPPAPQRVVLVVDEQLPAHLAANAAVVLGASIAATASLPLGPDGADASGTSYAGIVTTPIPVLVTDAMTLRQLFGAARLSPDIDVVTLTDVARRARTYAAYLTELATTEHADATLCAVVVAGPRNQVTRLTKRLSLMGSENA